MERLPNCFGRRSPIPYLHTGPSQGLNTVLEQLSRMRGAHVSPLTVALQLAVTFTRACRRRVGNLSWHRNASLYAPTAYAYAHLLLRSGFPQTTVPPPNPWATRTNKLTHIKIAILHYCSTAYKIAHVDPYKRDGAREETRACMHASIHQCSPDHT